MDFIARGYSSGKRHMLVGVDGIAWACGHEAETYAIIRDEISELSWGLKPCMQRTANRLYGCWEWVTMWGCFASDMVKCFSRIINERIQC